MITEPTGEPTKYRAVESWFKKYWRPAMGWMYLVICSFDFVIFPILWSILQATDNGKISQQWSPITLNGAGLFHISMGAILAVTAHGRSKEKIADSN